MALLAGAKLGDQIPGIRFGGGLQDQVGWIVVLLIAAYWLVSGIRFSGWLLLESLLTAEIWSDLVNKVYRNLMLQRYEFFVQNQGIVIRAVQSNSVTRDGNCDHADDCYFGELCFRNCADSRRWINAWQTSLFYFRPAVCYLMHFLQKLLLHI